MNWGWGGLAGAALLLIALEVTVSSSTATSMLGGLLQVPGRLAASWLDAGTALIPDKSTAAPAATTSSSSSSAAPPASAGNNVAIGTLMGPG